MRVNLNSSHSDWFIWRNSGVGSSDAPIISGHSPFSNPCRLLCEKSGLMKQRPISYHALRGVTFEPYVRDIYNRMVGKVYVPANYMHDERQWMRASIDGVDAHEDSMIEIKCPGKWSARKMVAYGPPLHYVIQMYHASLVSGIKHVLFLVFSDGKITEFNANRLKSWDVVARLFESRILHEEEVFYSEMSVLASNKELLKNLVDDFLGMRNGTDGNSDAKEASGETCY